MPPSRLVLACAAAVALAAHVDGACTFAEALGIKPKQ